MGTALVLSTAKQKTRNIWSFVWCREEDCRLRDLRKVLGKSSNKFGFSLCALLHRTLGNETINTIIRSQFFCDLIMVPRRGLEPPRSCLH